MMAILLMSAVLAMTGQAETLSDPTRPAEYQANVIAQDLPPELVDWRLTAIRISGPDRSAIVNNTIVREGDNVGLAKIVQILPDRVVLNYNSKQLVVSLFAQTAIKTPVDIKK
jgi:hypothetical protein